MKSKNMVLPSIATEVKGIVLGGFLGSGKTSVLLHLAKYLTELDTHPSVIILENEVGEIGIDDVSLRLSGFSVTNLFSGCACCTVAGELVSAVSKIRTTLHPDWLLIETTGLAYPRLMQSNLKNALSLETSIVIVVDASRWQRLFRPMAALLSAQIMGSDMVLLNKSDLAGPETIVSISRDIENIEPNTKITSCSARLPIERDILAALTRLGRE
jgi:G3E family GTPase